MLRKIYLLHFCLLSILLITSCEKDIREVALFDKGEIVAEASLTAIMSGETVSFNADASTKVQSLEWTFPNGNPGSSEDVSVDVTFVNPSTADMLDIDVLLTVKFIDNTIETQTIVITVEPADAPSGGTPLPPLDIAFVTDDVALDQGYIDLLTSEGHTVEAEASKYNNLDNTGAAELNGFDLVIISRATNSGNFGDASRPAWTTVTTPVLNLSSFISRSTRLHYFNSENQIETGGTSIVGTDPEHPIFTGISLGTDNSVIVTNGDDLHVINTIDAGTGTLLGTTGGGTMGTIAIFEPGAAYTGGDEFAGKRMFLSGTGGGFTYNDDGAKLFLNCFEYLITGAVFSSSLPFSELDIAFVTDDVALDQGYIDLLTSVGHTVEAEASKYNNLENAGAAELNGFDLVIISRATNSGNFGDASRPAWTTVTTPVLNLSSFISRSTRLHYFNSENQIETGGTILVGVDPSHPLFTNISLDANNSIALTGGDDLHVINTIDAGNGTLLGTTEGGTMATLAIFEPGAAYTGGDSFAGKRIFLSGTGGGFTYNDAGTQLFLNCVDFIAN